MRDRTLGSQGSLDELLNSGNPYSVLYAGVSGLTLASEKLGQEALTDLAEIVSRRIRHSVRGGDIAIPVNEREYAIVIQGSYDSASSLNLQDRVRHAVEQHVMLDDGKTSLRVDFGCASCPNDGNTYEEVLEHARSAMRRAQRSRERYGVTESSVGAAEDEHRGAFELQDVTVDPLTGLPGALHFRSIAATLVANAGKNAENIAVVFCDIEKFKEYNLKYGYESGDDLLKFLADTLEDAFPNDLIARLNSDRFGILTHDIDLAARLEAVHERVRKFRINSSIEFKAGICALKDCNLSTTRAQDYARLACDSIKGRYDYCCRRFDEALANQVQRRQHIVDNLDTAISSGWIEVFYQPIIRGITGKMCGAEALARWNDPTFGMLPPGEFIDVLEDAHLIHKLDICMVERVCADARRLLDSGFNDVNISINLSRLDYQLCDIFAVVEGIVEQSNVPKSSLHIEFTETAFTQDSEIFTNVIDKFRDAGYSVWMDDFGSGYSSLNSLKDYRFDVLKIDMAFLRGLEESSRTRDIVATVVDMAKKLGLQTLAEGVETEQHFAFLRSVGCEMMQGFLFGKPQRLDDLLSRVDAGELVTEDREMVEYYHAIGKVNMLSPAPFEREESSDTMVFSSNIPLAIVEEHRGQISTLASNPLFRTEIDSSEVAWFEGDAISFNAQGAKLYDEIVGAGLRAKESGEEVSFDFYDFKLLYTMRIMHVATAEGRNAFLVSLQHYNTVAELESRSASPVGGPAGGRMVYLPVAQSTPWQTSDELDLEHTALVVIDVLGGVEGVTPGLEDMARNCVDLVKAARAIGMPVIFNIDNHIEGLDQELELWGAHGIRGAQSGTPIAEFDITDSDYIIPKRRYNGFFETDLELTLRELGVTTLIVVGCDTNICVLQTLAGAYFYGYKTVVPSDATETFLIGTQESGLEYFTRCYDTRVVTTAGLLERMDASSTSQA